MISLVLQHLENLHSDLMTIDPAHRTDAADKVADLAMELRQMLAGVSGSTACKTAPAQVATVSHAA